MEHVTITELGNGMVRLVPNEGYRLFCTTTCLYYGEAVVKEKDAKFFIAEKEK